MRCSQVRMRFGRVTANAEVATVLGSIPTSSDTVESEGRQMKQCRTKYIHTYILKFLYTRYSIQVGYVALVQTTEAEGLRAPTRQGVPPCLAGGEG
jgi:hypothetical protein